MERDHGGPVQVAGSAGTGKTIVALHCAVHLVRSKENARVLLTTFSPALAHALHARLRRLVGRTPMLAERLGVVALDELGERRFKFAFGRPVLADEPSLGRHLDEAAVEVAVHPETASSALLARFGPGFLQSEWSEVIDPWQIGTWEVYRDFKQLGRKTRLCESQRTVVWRIFGRVRDRLHSEGRLTQAELFTRLAEGRRYVICPASAMTTPLQRLNLGCGPHPAPGWINADREPFDGVDVRGDLRHGLPLADGAVRYAVAMHVLQDLAWDELPGALAEIRRVIAPGGVLRLGLPDLDRAIDAYRRGDADYFYVPDADARSIGGKLVTQIIWYGSVRTPFTFDFAEEVLLQAGFAEVRRCAFGRTASVFADIVTLDNRERESLFVEARA